LKSMLKIAEDKFMIDGSSEECIKSLRLLGGVLAVEKGFKELGLDKKLKEIVSRRKIHPTLTLSPPIQASRPRKMGT